MVGKLKYWLFKKELCELEAKQKELAAANKKISRLEKQVKRQGNRIDGLMAYTQDWRKEIQRVEKQRDCYRSLVESAKASAEEAGKEIAALRQTANDEALVIYKKNMQKLVKYFMSEISDLADERRLLLIKHKIIKNYPIAFQNGGGQIEARPES